MPATNRRVQLGSHSGIDVCNAPSLCENTLVT